MPRLNIIILDKTTDDFNFVMWADVPVARQSRYANPSATSVWTGATTQDNTDLKAGVFTERVATQRIVPGTPMPQIQQFLQNQWSAFQSEINDANPWQRYGSTWDGTTWTVANNG
jgi:hypothetical protein